MKKFFLTLIRGLIGNLLYEKLCFYYAHRYWPDFSNPSTFSEHCVNRKLYNIPADASLLCDKYAVRDFVRRQLGPEGEAILNPVYWIGDNPDTIDWHALPPSFIAKATYASGSAFLIFVDDKTKMDERAFKKQAKAVLRQGFGALSSEPYYTTIPRRMVIERRIVDRTTDIPIDYKIYVFHGKVAFIQAAYDRFSAIKIAFFDTAWNLMPFSLRGPNGAPAPKPALLDRMILIAEKLAAGHDFLRVDLYSPNDEEVVFGEITIAPCAGRSWFWPDTTYDKIMGQLWTGAAQINKTNSVLN